MFVPISDEDVAAIVVLMNRAYRGAGGSAGWSTETAYLAGDRITDDLLRADIQANRDAAPLKWVDHPGASATGYVWLEPTDDQTWYLGSLTTHPDLQNAGLGRRMLAAAEDWVSARGGQRIRMTVLNVREALIAWYERRGYKPSGQTEPFPYGDDRFGTPLRNDLVFVVLTKDLVGTDTP